MNFTMIFIMFVLIKISFSLKPQEICSRSEKECKYITDARNQSKMVCQKVKCVGIFDYECEPNYCSLDKDSCDEFKSMKFLIETLMRPYANVKQTKSYQGLFGLIKKCTMLDYKWKPKEICINGEHCIRNQLIAMRTGVVKFYRKVECACPSKHPFRCSRNYCAIDETTCLKFDLKEVRNSTFRAQEMGVKKCDIDFKYIKD